MRKLNFSLLITLFLIGGLSALGTAKTIKADGTTQHYNLDGSDGSNGSDGSMGNSPSCESTGGSSNVSEPSGGNGGDGSNGQDGDDGDSVLAYYSDIQNLKNIWISNSGGDGGRGGSGARGGQGCSCSESSWSIDDGNGNLTYYSCSSGSDGSNGSDGRSGSDGSYGNISLVPSLDPIQPDVTSGAVDMTKLGTTSTVLAKSVWERKKGARALFAPKSDIEDSYSLLTGRNTVTVNFVWAANRPLTDFAGKTVIVRYDGTKTQISFPGDIWVQTVSEIKDNVQTVTIQQAIKTSEVSALSLGKLSGMDTGLSLTLNDKAGTSNQVQSVVDVKYSTWDPRGYYVQRYKGTLPTTAMTVEASALQLSLGALPIAKELLQKGTQVYLELNIKRSFNDYSLTQNLNQKFLISDFYGGDVVEATADANLYSVTTIIGTVKKGDKFRTVTIQGDWVSLQKVDGTAVRGWIKRSELKPSTP